MKERLLHVGRRAWARRTEATRALPVLIPVVLVLGVMIRFSDTVQFPHHQVPEGFVAAPPPTTLPAGLARPALPVVGGTTTTLLPPNQGTARLSGFVAGPDGAGVPGAIVRVERSIGDEVQALDIAAGPDGRYDLPGIGGGRYRVRAFLPPTLAQREAEVFFLAGGEARNVDLAVESFGVPVISIAVAPAVPLVGQPLSLAVRVTGRFVDPNGFVTVQPLVGGIVNVATTGSYVRQTPPGFLVTESDGAVVVGYTCGTPGPTQVQVAAQATIDAAPTTATFTAPDCVDPDTLTTTTSSTLPGASTSIDPGFPTTGVPPTTEQPTTTLFTNDG